MSGKAARGLPLGRPRVRALLRPALVAVGYLVAFVALDYVAFAFETAEGVSIWYPAAALDFVLFFVFGLRYWPVTMLNIPIHEYLLGAAELDPVALILYDVSANGVYALAAALLLYGVRINPRLRGQRDVVWFVLVACFSAPLLVALLETADLTLAGVIRGPDLGINVLSYWAGDATGIGMLAPFFLVLLRAVPSLWRDGPEAPVPSWRRTGLRAPAGRREALELAGQVALLATTIWVSYGFGDGFFEYKWFLFVPMMWIAVRSGFARVSLVVLLMNLGVAGLAHTLGEGAAGIPLQFSLMAVTLTSTLVGATVTQRKQVSAELAHRAYHDHLTDLPNRAHLVERLETAFRERGGRFAVLLLDLDRFKDVNGSLGHGTGDRMLVETARRLRDGARPENTVARLGGDEFALLIDDLPRNEEGARGAAEEEADRVLEALGEPYVVDGRELSASASAGLALGPGEFEGAEDLLRGADTALYRAKSGGRSRYVVFEKEMHLRVLERLRMENELRGALRRAELEVHYQPVFSTATGELSGVEALARWPHPERGDYVSPAEFVSLAEETGQIRALGLLVLRETCRRLREWDEARVPWAAVNVSAHQAKAPGLADEVLGVLRETGLPPRRLRLELTESAWSEEGGTTSENLERLAQEGVRISVDDFGTGYSSLGYLKRLPVHELKIDRSFLDGLPEDPDDAAIVRTILAVAQTFGLDVTAEGVETQAQLAFLRDHGCDKVQGYLLGRPAPSLPAHRP